MRTRTPLTALVATAALGLVLAGCSDDPDDEADPGSSTTGSTSSSPTTDEPTDEPTDGATEPTDGATSGEPTETTDPDGSTIKRAARAQMPADELPGLNDEWTWELDSEQEGPGESPPSVCMQTSLESIGAVGEYRTDYTSSLDRQVHAVQLTAVFPDSQTANLASTVLGSWHAQCADTARSRGLKQVDVGKLTKVPTSVGTGKTWLTTYRPVAGHPDESWFHAEGFVTDGDTMTYVVFVSPGQDYNYPAGETPAELALKLGADYLESSR